MKNVKPMKLLLLHKPYEARGRCQFAVTSAIFFPLSNPAALLPDIALWKFTAKELGKDAVLDLCMPKPRGEVLVVGQCHAPGGRPVKQHKVRVAAGGVDKTLLVYGERRWKMGLTGISPTEPEPFTVMPVDWAHAFGGPDYRENPLGKGAAPLPPGPDGEKVHPLPNIEDPNKPIRNVDSAPGPAGFGPLDFIRPQRFSKAGTHDQKWLDTRFPGYADDMDWSIFNAAPPDQWLKAHFNGDEEFTVEGMHPTMAAIKGRLPGLTVRCHVNQKTESGETFREIPTKPETLWLFPHADRGILVYRGVMEIATDDASDILQIIVGAERLAEPKGTEHYRQVLAQRMDKQEGAMQALRDDLLMPAGEPVGLGLGAEGEEMDKLVASKNLLQQNMRRKAEKELAASKDRLRGMREQLVAAAGKAGTPLPDLSKLDKALAAELPPTPPPPRIEDLPKITREAAEQVAKAKADAKATYAESLARLREVTAKAGVDLDKLMADAQAKAGGRPKFSADEQLQRLRELAAQTEKLGVKSPKLEQALADPDTERRLREAEAKLKETYQRNAHMFPPAPTPSPEDQQRLRQEVESRHKGGQGLASMDLSGIDLSGLDLKGARLSGAILDGANLSGCDLSGADLSGTVLARAKLAKARLSGARLTDACLGKADLTGADVSGGADLSGAILTGALLGGARLKGARMERANFMGAKLADADLSEVHAPDAQFLALEVADPKPPGDVLDFPETEPLGDADFSRLKLAGAKMPKALFLHPKLDGADFSATDLSGAVFLAASGSSAKFTGAKLENLRVVMDSSLPGADFSEARLDRANLRGTDLSGARFSRASLGYADLSECKLAKADLTGVPARGARFAKADLTGAAMTGINLAEGILQKARLPGAVLAGANLFCADLLKVVVDDKTDLTGANRKKALIKPAGKP